MTRLGAITCFLLLVNLHRSIQVGEPRTASLSCHPMYLQFALIPSITQAKLDRAFPSFLLPFFLDECMVIEIRQFALQVAPSVLAPFPKPLKSKQSKRKVSRLNDILTKCPEVEIVLNNSEDITL